MNKMCEYFVSHAAIIYFMHTRERERVCVHVYFWRAALARVVVVSLLPQHETGTEVFRSQGTDGFRKGGGWNITIAQASSSRV